MLFGFTFAFVGSAYATSSLEFLFMVLLVTILAINLVLLQYDYGRLASLWITIAIFAIIYIYDFWITANSKQKNAFYIPMFVEAIAFSIGYILYRFEFPDRICRNNRFS